MEVALVSVATGALKSVLSKLATLLSHEYKRLKAVGGDIRFLSNELAAMHAFLLNMSEKEDLDVQDKLWMNEVRELSYDMEDSIDDFMQCIVDNDEKPDGFIEKIKNSLRKLGKIKGRRRVGSEIQDLKKQIIEVGDINARYKTHEAFSRTPETFTNIRNAVVDPRALAIFEHASKLVGIEKPKAEIIKLLTQEDGCFSSQQELKVVSIVGSGGMGKTTLANQVYQDLKGKFECQAFLSVSRNPDMMKILRTILSEVAKKDYAQTEARDEQQLLSKISNFLVDKSYFIVVDDIWKKETWDVIKCAFPMTSCGIIITTTRINDVADSCRSSYNGHIYNIRPLDIVNSTKLFYRRLFKFEEDCPSYLKEVSEQILKKCDGLPLAIIAISGLLANKERTEHAWNQVRDSIGRALERNSSVEAMIKILSLSYFDLPPHLKTCLLCLSIFPEDSTIRRKCLIRRWMVEGFIRKEGGYTVHELGERCFNELVNRNLIQLWDSKGNGNMDSCRVHDIILDFIISKSIEENFVTFLGVPNLTTGTQSKVRRLSVQYNDKGNSTLPTGSTLSHVRSLNVFGNAASIACLDEFKHLRILDFGGCHQLQDHHLDNIGRLFWLRYLNLNGTRINELSEQIGHAHCLEILDLRNTHVDKVPASIVKLRNLVHLFVEVDVEFPCGISKIQALEILREVNIFIQPSNFLQELGQLKNLRNLCLNAKHDLKDIDYAMMVGTHRAIASSLQNLGLHSLKISCRGSFLQEPLCPLPLSLRKFVTYNSPLTHVPKWVRSLVNLQQLSLQVADMGQEDMCTLGGLPNLLILRLTRIGWSRNKLIVSGLLGFQCLREFRYVDKTMNIMFVARSMPRLEKLEIKFSAYTIESVDFGIENLSSLIILSCNVHGFRTESIDRTAEATKAAMERAVTAHPNYPTLQFI